jgi:hypothetical protein
MNKFDQLLKEKVNEIEYPYKPAYWNNFIQSAHLQTMSAGIKIALWSAAGAVGVAGGGYAVYHFANQNNNNQEITIIQSHLPSDTTAQYVDFADSVSCEQKKETNKVFQTAHSSNPKTMSTPDIIQHDNVTDSPVNSSPNNPSIDPTSNIKWRVLTIDVDTIKSNR